MQPVETPSGYDRLTLPWILLLLSALTMVLLVIALMTRPRYLGEVPRSPPIGIDAPLSPSMPPAARETKVPPSRPPVVR